MHVVALTRWNQGTALDGELSTLAQLMGLGLYDARLRLAGPLPVFVASGLDLDGASRVLSGFRARAHGAVALDVEYVPDVERLVVPRRLELREDGLSGLDSRAHPLALSCSDIIGLIGAIEVSDQTQASTSVERKLAVGRAVLSGGLKFTKTVATVERSQSIEHQEVAYLFRRGESAPVLLKEHVLSYDGLAELRGKTAHQSFRSLVEWLQARSPDAAHDERMLVRKRRADLTAVHGPVSQRTLQSSNAPANTLAAYALMVAHLQGQV